MKTHPRPDWVHVHVVVRHRAVTVRPSRTPPTRVDPYFLCSSESGDPKLRYPDLYNRMTTGNGTIQSGTIPGTDQISSLHPRIMVIAQNKPLIWLTRRLNTMAYCQGPNIFVTICTVYSDMRKWMKGNAIDCFYWVYVSWINKRRIIVPHGTITLCL